LVTSYFNDPDVIHRCQKLGVRIIPKSAIHLIDIELAGASFNPGLRIAEHGDALREEEKSEA
jgi:hypothetical protein